MKYSYLFKKQTTHRIPILSLQTIHENQKINRIMQKYIRSLTVIGNDRKCFSDEKCNVCARCKWNIIYHSEAAPLNCINVKILGMKQYMRKEEDSRNILPSYLLCCKELKGVGGILILVPGSRKICFFSRLRLCPAWRPYNRFRCQ